MHLIKSISSTLIRFFFTLIFRATQTISSNNSKISLGNGFPRSQNNIIDYLKKIRLDIWEFNRGQSYDLKWTLWKSKLVKISYVDLTRYLIFIWQRLPSSKMTASLEGNNILFSSPLPKIAPFNLIDLFTNSLSTYHFVVVESNI